MVFFLIFLAPALVSAGDFLGKQQNFLGVTAREIEDAAASTSVKENHISVPASALLEMRQLHSRMLEIMDNVGKGNASAPFPHVGNHGAWTM